jgi:hypothetical protein
MDPMEEATNKQQIKFSVQTVSYQIEEMIKKGGTHLFYSEIAEGDRQYRPCVLQKHIPDVVIALQQKYQGQFVVSRTPGGIVVDSI